MSVRTLQRTPNRHVFRMPCDNAGRLQTPAQSYCGCQSVSSGPRAQKPIDFPSYKAIRKFMFVPILACFLWFVIMMLHLLIVYIFFV